MVFLNLDIIVTCSRDNSINVHDLRVKSAHPVNRINDAHCVVCKDSTHSRNKLKTITSHVSSPSNSVTDIVFIDDNNLISSGASDGLVKRLIIKLNNIY